MKENQTSTEVFDLFKSIKDLCEDIEEKHLKKVIITGELAAERVLFTDMKDTGLRRYQIMDLNLLVYPVFLTFNRNSHFIQKFAKIDQLIYESGLDQKWDSDFKVENRIDDNVYDDLFIGDNDLLRILMSVLGIGLSFATIAFLFECLYHWKKNREEKLFVKVSGRRKNRKIIKKQKKKKFIVRKKIILFLVNRSI